MSAFELLLLSLASSPGSDPAGASVALPPLTTRRVTAGLIEPVYVTAPPGDPRRLFVLEFNTGRIRIVDGGALLPTPFLDLGPLVTDVRNFGLLGLAFHPDYAHNGRFYVQYVDNALRPVVARYRVSADPYRADAASAQLVLQLAPIVDHQGGAIAFGPNDGYLYVGIGDGQESDPSDHAQDDGSLFGKILRLDVDSAVPYAIPPTNPFVGPGNPRDEIWAKGLRNPFRFAFDRASGELYIGDVGENAREEIDYQPGASAGGLNYGWRRKEGDLCFNPPTGCNLPGLIPPLLDYPHEGSSCTGSVTGGSVYRGREIPALSGTYFFADYCTGRIGSFRLVAGTLTEFAERTDELAPGGGLSIDRPTAIGEDAAGELYIVDFDGELYAIVRDQHVRRR